MESKFCDGPKALWKPEVRQEREELRYQPRVKRLNEFVDKLRADTGKGSEIPYFDPLDGGVEACCLFLFQAPGDKAVESGFISRNNNDPTASNFFKLNEEAGLGRRLTASWNVVPWYLDSVPKRSDIDQSIPYLWELLGKFDSLKFIVLGGKQAQRIKRDIKNSDFTGEIIKTWHPSSQSLNTVPSHREGILNELRKIAQHCHSLETS